MDGILITGRIFKEILITRDTMTFLGPHLDFMINIKKSIPKQTQKAKFLWLIIGSPKMILALIEEKLTKITRKCQHLLSQAQTIVLVVA